MAYYYGSASWFCCGHAGSWSSRCADTGHGSCGNCESYLDHAAWPKLKRPGYPDCNVSDNCLPLPWKYCGDTLVVYNRCNGKQVTVEVHDCGPNTNRANSATLKKFEGEQQPNTRCSRPTSVGAPAGGRLDICCRQRGRPVYPVSRGQRRCH